ncbi:MAG TPA: DUF6134 family protein [Pseudomonadales bacterium]|nr:DUF6134 family protein [Pseudomonadales bacterium]
MHGSFIQATTAMFRAPHDPHGNRLARARRVLVGVLVALTCAAPLAGLATPDLVDRNFRVFIDDKEVGTHRFTFEGRPDAFTVTSKADFAYKLAFVTLFRYRHEARERWEGGCMVRLDAETTENGDAVTVAGRAMATGFSLSRPDDGATYDLDCAWGFAYWDPQLRERQTLINPDDGALFDVTWEALGDTPLSFEGRSLRTRAWALRSDGTGDGEGIDITLYYDRDDRWIALDAQVGSRTLRYRTAQQDPFAAR